MFICKVCKNELMDGTIVCPHCGKRYNYQSSQSEEYSPFSDDFSSPNFDPNFEDEEVRAVYRDDVLQVYDKDEAERTKRIYGDDYEPDDEDYVHQYVEATPPIYKKPPRKKVNIIPMIIIMSMIFVLVTSFAGFSLISNLMNSGNSFQPQTAVEVIGEEAEDAIEWANPSVESMVRVMLGKETGSITISDLWNIEELYLVSGKMFSKWQDYSSYLSQNNYNYGAMVKIDDLSDLKYFKNVYSLDLINVEIDNCDFLEEFYDLQYLDFQDCKINSFVGLENLHDLYSINFTDIYSDNWDEIPNITGLVSLNISGGNIYSLKFLENCSNIESIYLYNTAITDFSVLENMIYLNYLHISDANMLVAPDLSKLSKLSSLSMDDCGLTDISFVAELTNLKDLSFDDNLITDVSSLENLLKLETLSISYNHIEDISALTNLKNLTFLTLNDNLITDISPLTDLNKLNYLYIDDNLITDYSPLDGKTYEINK